MSNNNVPCWEKLRGGQDLNQIIVGRSDSPLSGLLLSDRQPGSRLVGDAHREPQPAQGFGEEGHRRKKKNPPLLDSGISR